MKTGDLLKSLLDQAEVSQKDFADSVYLSPSTISKTINAKIMIRPNDAESFSTQCSIILARALYEHDPANKLGKIFPAIPRFSSRHDLEYFLLLAFRYVIDLDHRTNDSAQSRINRSTFYAGGKNVLYMFCIILSDYLQRDYGDAEDLVLYSSIPRFFGKYAAFIDQIQFFDKDNPQKTIIHQFFNPRRCELWSKDYSSDVLAATFQFARLAQVRFWRSDSESGTPFLALWDEFVMLFGQQLDDSPTLTVVTNAHELERLHEYITLMLSLAQLRSYDDDNIKDYLADIRDAGTDAGINSVYRKLEFLLNLSFPSDLEVAEIEDRQRAFFDELLAGNVAIYLSTDLLQSFLFSPEDFVPIFAIADLSLEVRIKVLELMKNYIVGKKAAVYIVNTPLKSLIIQSRDDLSLLTLLNPGSRKFEYHFFAGELMRPVLSKLLSAEIIDIGDYIDTLIYQTKTSLKHWSLFKGWRLLQSDA